MANDRWFKPGSNYILSDLSGRKIRVERARIIPGGITGGLAVDVTEWEPQQPQDFVTGVRDDQVAALVRSRQVNQFTIVGTFVIAPSARLTDVITVDSVVGFAVGSRVQIMLDSGENFLTTIASIAGDQMTLAAALPASVGTSFGDPLENSVLLLSN